LALYLAPVLAHFPANTACFLTFYPQYFPTSLCVGFLFFLLCTPVYRPSRPARSVTHTQHCGTWWHWRCFCVAGVALVALDWLRWRAWSPVTPWSSSWQT
jgi:hypothetical protein